MTLKLRRVMEDTWASNPCLFLLCEPNSKGERPPFTDRQTAKEVSQLYGIVLRYPLKVRVENWPQ